MSRKHAILIMAHHRYEVLYDTLSAFDSENIDFYINLDEKSKEKFIYKPNKSKIYINNYNVMWGGYSQVDCTLQLLNRAFKNDKYIYFHFITGVTYPIKSLKYFIDFFEKNNGIEFIGFDNKKDFSERLRYIHLFNEIGKKNNKLINKLEYKFRYLFIKLQKLINFDLFKKYKLEPKKGMAYWHITNNCAKYVLSNKLLIRKMCIHSFCCDEVFMQTLVFNSSFKDKIYNIDDDMLGSLFYSSWDNNKPHLLELNDFDIIKNSKCLFALKFEGKEAYNLINKIKKELVNNE